MNDKSNKRFIADLQMCARRVMIGEKKTEYKRFKIVLQFNGDIRDRLDNTHTSLSGKSTLAEPALAISTVKTRR